MPSTPRLWALTLVTSNRGGRAAGRLLGQQMRGIQGRPARHRLVGIDGAVGLDAGELLQHAGDHRHPRGTADQQDAVDVLPLQAGGGQQLPRRVGRPLQQIGRHLLELLAGDCDFAGAAGKFDADRGPVARAERVLGLHGDLKEPVERRRVLAGIELVRLEEASAA